MLRLPSSKAQELKKFENHLNPFMMVFPEKLSLSTNIRVPICKGFSHFSALLLLHFFCIDHISEQQLRVKWPKIYLAHDVTHLWFCNALSDFVLLIFRTPSTTRDPTAPTPPPGKIMI